MTEFGPWIAECEVEPIERPGAIQGWGALLVADAADMVVRHASANLAAFIGQAPAAVLGRTLDSVLDPAWLAACAPVVLGRHHHGDAIGVDIEAGAARPPGDARSVFAALHAAAGAAALQNTAAAEIRRVSGFERAMVYRFDQVGHGEVVAEDVAPEAAAELEPFLGLHYPASDIPRQARRLYLLQLVRVIADAAAPVVPICSAPGAASPDLSLAALRAPSPLHRDYLRNLGVRATLAVSLIVDGALWGMLVCHHRRPHAVSADTRALCEMIGQVTSLMIAGLQAAETRAVAIAGKSRVGGLARRLAVAPGGSAGLAAALAGSGAELLGLCAAVGAIIRIFGHTHSLGAAPGGSAADDMLDALLAVAPAGGAPLAASELARLLPPAQCHDAAGGLLLPLHRPGDAILWLRREQARLVRWGGDPRAARVADGIVQPRCSFAVWLQHVQGEALPWTAAEIEAVQALKREIEQVLVRHAEAELALLRHHDPLTGLANRRQLRARLAEWAHERPGACLLVIEIDRFKALNDLLGEAAGDALLIQAGERIARAAARPGLLVAHIGANEFAVFSDAMGAGEANALAATLLAVLSEPFAIAERQIRITASVGIAPVSGETSGSGADDLMTRANLALQAAKTGGGNRALMFNRALRAGADRHIEIEQELRAVIEGDVARAGSFRLVYQPCVGIGCRAASDDAATESAPLRGFEALLRWRHPRLGDIMPGEFIGLAEGCDLIIPLGEWVLRDAIGQIARWCASGLGPPDAAWHVAVNVSPRQLVQPGFAGGVSALLQAQGVAPQRLAIEVTEGVFADATAAATVAELRAAGVRILVDDFGCGYSSLSYLRRLPADELKLDRSFLECQDGGSINDNLLAALVQLARAVGLSVLAEGVETEQQLAVVWACGCDAAQGWLFARPGTAEEAAAWIIRAGASARPGKLAAPEANPPLENKVPFSFRDVVEAAADAIVVTMADLEPPGPTIIYANPAFARMSGLRLREMLGRSPRILQGPGTDPDVLRRLGQALRASGLAQERLLNYTRGGEGYEVELSISPLRDQDGRITHFVAIERAAAEMKPARSGARLRRRFEAAVNHMSQGLCLYDADDRLELVNQRFCDLYNQPMWTLRPGMHFRDILAASLALGNHPGRTLDAVYAERKAFIDRREPGVFMQEVGADRLIAIFHRPLPDGGWLATYEDVTDRRRAEAQLKFMADHDPLTLLPNRRLFLERLAQAVSDAARAPCALLFLDLDGFKSVNDRLGHAAGDALLRHVADRLGRVLRDGELIARLGGDEFAVLLPCGSLAAVPVGEAIIASIQQPFELDDEQTAQIGVSVGIAAAPEHATTPDLLLSCADAALYAAKRNARGTARLSAA